MLAFMSNALLCLLAAVLALCDSCTTTDPAASAAATSNRVILSNDIGSTVRVTTDLEALRVQLNFIINTNSETRAKEEALEVEGRTFTLPNGTRADVLQEGNNLLAPKDESRTDLKALMEVIKPLYVRLTTGSRAGERVWCFKSVTQVDR